VGGGAAAERRGPGGVVRGGRAGGWGRAGGAGSAAGRAGRRRRRRVRRWRSAGVSACGGCVCECVGVRGAASFVFLFLQVLC
jgi:hypothetical protein